MPVSTEFRGPRLPNLPLTFPVPSPGAQLLPFAPWRTQFIFMISFLTRFVFDVDNFGRAGKSISIPTRRAAWSASWGAAVIQWLTWGCRGPTPGPAPCIQSAPKGRQQVPQGWGGKGVHAHMKRGQLQSPHGRAPRPCRPRGRRDAWRPPGRWTTRARASSSHVRSCEDQCLLLKCTFGNDALWTVFCSPH